MVNINDYIELEVGDFFINKQEMINSRPIPHNCVVPVDTKCEIYDIIRERGLDRIRTTIHYKYKSRYGNDDIRSSKFDSGFFELDSVSSYSCYMWLREKNLKLLNI